MNYLNILATTIVEHSIKIKEDDNVLISVETMEPLPLVKEIIKKIQEHKGNVSVKIFDPFIDAMILNKTLDSKLDLLEKSNKFEVDNYDCFIRIYCNQNDYEDNFVDSQIRKKVSKKLENVHNIMIDERRWVLLQYPSRVDAYKAKMSYDEFYNFSMNAMCEDYIQMAKDIKPLKELMEKTNKVRITGKSTDITFSILGMPIIPCCGEANIPDGECYTAPIKNSVNGIIKYNTPSPYQGDIYNGVTLEFKDGKIIKAYCDDETKNEKLNKIFDTDEGARYIGEFSIGLNKKILYPMGDILFDEKIKGSIHFTPGKAYKGSYNGNNSAIHWDMVLIQREDFGGGNIYFDDTLIRENGIFVIDNLKHLN